MATRLPSGQYRAQVLIGKDASGKRQYRSFIADSSDEADYLALKYKLGKGKRAQNVASRTVRECVKDYIDVREAIPLSPTTISGYREKARNTFQGIMDLKVDKLTNALLQTAAYTDLKTKSVKTVREGFNLVKSAVKPYLDFTPEILLPKVKNPKRKVTHTIPDKTTLAKLISAAHGTELEVPILLASWLSFRASEIAGLKWTSIRDGVIDLTESRVYADGKDYVKDPKTMDSARRLPLPAMLRDALDRHRNDYDSEYIYAPSPHHLSLSYIDFVKRQKDVPYHTFHDLRHTNASLMLLVMPDKYAQKRGGWKGNAVMKKYYQDTFAPEELEYAATFDAMFESEIMSRATRNATRYPNTPDK